MLNLVKGRGAGVWGRSRLRQAQESLAQLEDNYELTVEALAAALELRDDETGSHARRVTQVALELARTIAPELAANPELRYGFLLHDIGKIGIPDGILLKPGPLTAQEMKQLEQHTTLGEHLVASIPYLSGVAREVIAYHHERWDGLGYPWALQGEKIPLAARIFSVADAFDAITSDRPYRAARSPQTAIEELQKKAGSQFDPWIVQAFTPIAKTLVTASA